MKIKLIENVSKNTQVSNFMKIRPVEDKLFHAERRRDGRTYKTKLIIAFRNYANARKKAPNYHHIPGNVATNQLPKQRAVIHRCSTRHRGLQASVLRFIYDFTHTSSRTATFQNEKASYYLTFRHRASCI